MDEVKGRSASAQVAALELRVEELQEQVAEHARAEAAADRSAQECMAQVAQLRACRRGLQQSHKAHTHRCNEAVFIDSCT